MGLFSPNTAPSLSTPTSGVIFILVALSFVIAYFYQKSSEFAARSAGRPLPPGPPGIPFLGNLFDLPKSSPWLGYRELSRRYGASSHTYLCHCQPPICWVAFAGDLAYLQVLGRSILLINDSKIASALLEKRSVVNSSRPVSTAVER